MTEPYLLLLNAGGTISAEVDQPSGVLRAGDSATSLTDALPTMALPVIEQRVYRGLSEDMTPENVCQLMMALKAALSDPFVVGVVVAHGTDTLEESAFLADLILGGDTPVVFTGSQRAPNALGYDGVLNLTDALAVAASSSARGLGVLIVFAGRMLAARYAHKQRTTAPDAFASYTGEVGCVSAKTVQLFARPVRYPALTFVGLEPSVDIVTAGLGVTGHGLDLLIADGARGVVLQALGRGNVGRSMTEAAASAIAAGCIVLVVSRSNEGGVAPDYESGQQLANAGALFCGQLNAAKARLVLASMLASGMSSEQIRTALMERGLT